MKPLQLAAVAGSIIIAVLIAVFYVITPAQVIASYSSGDITVQVVEDNSRRFLAKVENNGPELLNAAAFAVKKGLNSDCEPQGIVVSNFAVETRDGKLVASPDSIPAGASVNIDSQKANIGTILPSTETTVYILQLEQDSIRATDVLHKIPIQQSDSTELEQYEDCLAGRGYPLLLKLTGLQKGSQTYFTVDSGSGEEKYETSFSLAQDAPDFPAVYWPDSRQNWLSANFTRQAGPAPSWQEPETLRITVRTVIISGQVVDQFEAQVAPQLRTASLDFAEVAKGNAVPVYPKYWEIMIDLTEKTIG